MSRVLPVLRRHSFLPHIVPCLALASLCAAFQLACSSSDEHLPTGGTGATGTGGDKGTGGAGLGGGGMGGSGADPCADVTCEPGSECVADGATVSCVCADTDCVASKCEADSCDPNATCTEKDDGFTCSCNSGYFGSGFECQVDSLCAGVVCPGENQRCLSDGVAAACVCRNGFEADVANDCRDIDECASAPCGSNATCENFAGGFACDCEVGFTKNAGGECVSADLCGGPANVCGDLGMVCNDAAGKVSCECQPNEVPGVNFCKATSACTPGICGSGDCVDTKSGYLCYCPPGTTGQKCADTTSCSLSTVLNKPGSPIIADPTLRRAVENAAGIYDGSAVTVGDLAGFRVIGVNRMGSEPAVASLEGLECLPWLQELYVGDGDVSDLSPLANLNALRVVDLSCNPVTSIAALAGKSVQELRLAQTSACTGASAHLASPSSLTGLEYLHVLDVSGQSLGSDPGLSSLSFLQELIIAGNSIDALNDLGTMPSLEVLVASSTGTKAFSGLSAFPSLRSLDVSASSISSLSGLSAATELRSLKLNDLGLTDLSGIGSLPNLASLSATGNAIASLSVIAGSSTLHSVSLVDNSVTSLDDLVEAKPLKFRGTLQLDNNDLDCAEYAAENVALADAGIFVTSDCD